MARVNAAAGSAPTPVQRSAGVVADDEQRHTRGQSTRCSAHCVTASPASPGASAGPGYGGDLRSKRNHWETSTGWTSSAHSAPAGQSCRWRRGRRHRARRPAALPAPGRLRCPLCHPARCLRPSTSHPSHLEAEPDWPVGVAFRAELASLAAGQPFARPEVAGWFCRLPEEMHDEQRAFLRAHGLAT